MFDPPTAHRLSGKPDPLVCFQAEAALVCVTCMCRTYSAKDARKLIALLRERASAQGIDYDQPETYDAREFPKIVRHSDLLDGDGSDVCDSCHAPIRR